MAETFEDVACTVCGCVCDDLRVTVEGGQIVKAEGACFLAEPAFLGREGQGRPVAEIAGQPVELAAAIERAAEVLAAARYPLIYGLSRSSTPGQRAAVELGDRLGAVVDTTASQCHAPSIMAIQEVGESTSTLGEIKNRADLVIFWGCDPATSHPRHLERYSGSATGELIPNGREDRTLVVIDVKPTETSRQADVFIELEAARDFEAIAALRLLVAGEPVPAEWAARLPLEDLTRLAEMAKGCRYGVVFFGLGLAQTGASHRNVETLLRLVTELNAHARFCARRMRIPGDVTGADSVLCWQTGFPFSVSLAKGYPRYNPGEYSADDVLARGEADACLLVGSEGVAELSAAATAHLGKISLVVLDHPREECLVPPTVRITTGVYGIHYPGTVYRMDEVPVPLRAMLPTRYPSDEAVLKGIGQRVGEVRRGTR